ncbi:MAG: N-acetylornithine carbamoyltransferase [Planctomycetes bacterium]|nr:N-acetylornithine carbamoyltransferase [Planctomycetota bacterium]
MIPTPSPAPRHLIRLHDLEPSVIDDLIDHAQRLKRRAARADLAGRTIGMLFFRGSLRTRTSFEAAVHQLGGHTINLNATSDFWELEDREGTVMDGKAPEHIKDAARALSHYVNALAIRPSPAGQSWPVDRRDAQITSWARHSSVPVINMESALWHPLQALADMMTLRESLGDLKGKKIALVWVHSPEPASLAVPHSLLVPALRAGMQVSVAHPPGFGLDEGVVGEAQETAARSATKLQVGCSLEEAVRGADVVYARSWQSLEDYGNTTLAASRRARLSGWKVDERLMGTGRDARFMHAMPVRRNVEATDQVLDSARSLVQTQAENRLHTQKALLAMLLKGVGAA